MRSMYAIIFSPGFAVTTIATWPKMNDGVSQITLEPSVFKTTHQTASANKVLLAESVCMDNSFYELITSIVE